MRILKIIGLTLGIGGGAYLFFIVALVFGPYLNNFFNREDFDSERWKNWKETEAEMSLRWNMISDLEENYELKGMTPTEVVDLLGEPDSKNSFEWTYYLGMAGHGIDTGTLSLTFENGKVKSYTTYRG
jgi:hypothetical protein